MKRAKWLLLLAVGFMAVAPLFLWERAVEPGPGFAYYQEQPSAYRLVEVMNGKSNLERRMMVKQALQEAGLDFREEPFTTPIYQGVNLIADIGTGRDILLFAAHYDRVPKSPGANDNASCVGAGIEALKVLKQKNELENLTLRFVFNDGEEVGMQGSHAYADAHDLTHFFGVASFELCGIGNAFGVWDVIGPAMNSPLVEALMRAGKNIGVYNGTHGEVPRFGSDHRAFAKKGLPAVGVTLLPQKDESTLRDYVDDPNNAKWLLNFIRPTIFQTYHTSGDKPETVQADTLEMATRLMVETVRLVDEMVKGNG